MAERTALEERVEHIQNDVADLKKDIRRLDEKIDRLDDKIGAVLSKVCAVEISFLKWIVGTAIAATGVTSAIVFGIAKLVN
jgi:hypothetical protein